MVVSDDNRAGPVGNSVRKYLARMHGATVDQTNGDDPDVQNLVRAVDRGAEKVLLFTVCIMSDLRE